MGFLAGGALIVASYAAGAVPWGVVLGRLFQNTDLREHGSGATGTTNAYRVLGWRISAAVLTLDFLKGLLPVLVGRWLGASDWLLAAVAVATVVGHCWSPFIRFDGGKGVATGAGAAAGLFPWVLLVLPLMVAIVAVTRYVSLASLVGSVLAAVGITASAALGGAAWATAVGISAMVVVIVVQHRGNIRRLLAGNERRLVRRQSG